MKSRKPREHLDIKKFFNSFNKANMNFLIRKSYERTTKENIVFIVLMLFSLFATIFTIYGMIQTTDRTKSLFLRGGLFARSGGGRMMIMLIALCIILTGLITIECLGCFKKQHTIKLIDEVHQSK